MRPPWLVIAALPTHCTATNCYFIPCLSSNNTQTTISHQVPLWANVTKRIGGMIFHQRYILISCSDFLPVMSPCFHYKGGHENVPDHPPTKPYGRYLNKSVCNI